MCYNCNMKLAFWWFFMVFVMDDMRFSPETNLRHDLVDLSLALGVSSVECEAVGRAPQNDKDKRIKMSLGKGLKPEKRPYLHQFSLDCIFKLVGYLKKSNISCCVIGKILRRFLPVFHLPHLF